MSDLAATNCGCGREGNNNGCSSIIWIILLLSCFGNNGSGFGRNDNNNCCSIIWIILLLSCCGNGCGNNDGGFFC